MSRLILALGLFAVGCGGFEPPISGSGKMATENRPVGTFSTVDCAISCTIDVKKGDATSVELSVDDNLLPLIKTEVQGDKLRVYSDRNLAPSDGARIVITTPSLSGFAAAGAVTAVIEELSGSRMRIALAGSGDVTGRVAGESLEAEIAGSGAMKLEGTAQKLSVSIAGSSNINAAKVAADEVSIEIAGSGKVQVAAQKKLDISIAGSGEVVYSGDAEVKQSIAGIGTVTKVEPSTDAPKLESDSAEAAQATESEVPNTRASGEK